MLWLSMSTSPMTWTSDFQGQILKNSYLRNWRADWHGTKGMWVDRMLHPLCDFQLWPKPWPWPWIFKVKFWKSRILWMGWPIDMERNGCELIECWTHVVTFNVHLTHDLDLGFSRSNFEKVISQELEGRLTGKKKGMWVDRMLHPLCDFQLWPKPWPWPWIFMVKFWKSRILWMGWPIDMERKGCELIKCCDFQCSPLPWPWLWIF